MPHPVVVTSKREQKYARALDALDARKASGAVSTNEYDLLRAGLMAEAAKPRWHWGIQLAAIVGIVIAFFVVLRVVGALVNAANS